MAALLLPGRTDEPTARALQRALLDEDDIEVPITSWPVRAARSPGDGPTIRLIRISAQRYNEPADFDRLADTLGRRLAAE